MPIGDKKLIVQRAGMGAKLVVWTLLCCLCHDCQPNLPMFSQAVVTPFALGDAPVKMDIPSTRVLVLYNMVTKSELLDYDEYSGSHMSCSCSLNRHRHRG